MARLRAVMSPELTLIVVEGWEGLKELTSPSHISVYRGVTDTVHGISICNICT